MRVIALVSCLMVLLAGCTGGAEGQDPQVGGAPDIAPARLWSNDSFSGEFSAVRLPSASYYDGPAGIRFGTNQISRVQNGTVQAQWSTVAGPDMQMTLVARSFLGAEYSVTGPSPLALELPEIPVEHHLVLCLRPTSAVDDAAAQVQIEHTLTWSIAYEGVAELEQLTSNCD